MEGISSVCTTQVGVVGSQFFHHSLGGIPALFHGFTAQCSNSVGDGSDVAISGMSSGDGRKDGVDVFEGETAGEVNVVGEKGVKGVVWEYSWEELSSRSGTIVIGL